MVPDEIREESGCGIVLELYLTQYTSDKIISQLNPTQNISHKMVRVNHTRLVFTHSIRDFPKC